MTEIKIEWVQLSSNMANAFVKTLRHEIGLTDHKVEFIRYGNDLYVYINNNLTHKIEIV